ncbi:ABC transporter permease [Catenulispora yoronensis]|uniref:ABC transporter permease n=1 Tax=Catenulispora yoronensis TaxID=450799 RepID=A0ABP5H1W9_9ACTN
MNVLSDAWGWLTTASNWHGSDGIPTRFLEHFEYSVEAVLIGALIAFPLGLLTGHTKRGGLVVTSLANIARALPTLGLVVLLVVVIGVKFRAVMIPLVALTVPPILLNTYEGVRNVDPRLTDAAQGMGLRPWQVLWRAEVPAAMPLILTGFQFAAVNAVANTAIAAYSSFGGLGRYIIDGLATTDYGMVAGGAILIVVAAILNLVFFAVLRRVLISPGLQSRERASA